MTHPPTTLAATVHDPRGHLLAALPRLIPRITGAFSGIALNVSDATHPAVTALLSSFATGLTQHPTGLSTVGRARRDAVGLALGQGAGQIIYSDFDHMARWLEAEASDLGQILTTTPDADLLIVGRSPAAFAAEPARLRETEALVNWTYELLTGRRADLMFAVRLLNRRAAELIVARSEVDTLASDVDWPLLAERTGLRIGYAESQSLYYRTMEEFGAPRDTGDGDPENWIARLEFAALHATAMRAYLKSR